MHLRLHLHVESRSGLCDRTGKAFGTLSTVALAPLPASKGVSDLAKQPDLTLVPRTEPFTGGPLPLP